MKQGDRVNQGATNPDHSDSEDHSESGRPAAVILLAAGAGTRMKSKTPKILHRIGGNTMVGHALAAARTLNPEILAAVVRFERDTVAAHLSSLDPEALIVDQDDIPGTGRAVEVGLAALGAELTGTIVVTQGDVPLVSPELLRQLVSQHEKGGNAVTAVTTVLEDPGMYGRILRDDNGMVKGIREFKDATEHERDIKEINAAIYAFDAETLRESLTEVTLANSQGEKYLTDVLALAYEKGGRVEALVCEDTWQVEGANDRVQLADLAREHNRRTLERAMRQGVSIQDPASTWVDETVTFDRDVTLLPGTHLHGTTHISEDAVIGPDTTIQDSHIGEAAQVRRSEVHSSRVSAGAAVGPYSYLRPGTELGAGAKIGTFVETKNSSIGAGSKVPHLSYVGDASIGEQSNIGAASVFVNYDGVNKSRTIVGSHVRMGSDNMYVAPVSVGDGAYSGAGTVIRKDVPAGALAINVAPQRNIEGWVLDKRAGTAAAEAASKVVTGQGISEGEKHE